MPLPDHIQWLVRNRSTPLQACLRAQGVDMQAGAVIEVLCRADPSPGLHAVQWVCDSLIRGGMLWEDVAAGASSKTAETLAWFAQHRSSLPAGKRNLEDYADLGGVWRAVQPFVEPDHIAGEVVEVGGRELRRQQRAAARQDSIMVHESAELVVAVPTTQQAACWWGRGTRWCTAADSNNYFDSYNHTAPLIVVVMPGLAKAKLQLHMGSTISFMDAADSRVERDFIETHWNVLGPLVLWGLASNPSMIAYVPHSLQTEQMSRQAIDSNGKNLVHMAPHLMTPDLCAMAVEREPRALGYVPKDMMTVEMCTSAVTRYPPLLYCVPKHMQTAEMCKLVVENEPYYCIYVRQDLQTLDMLKQALLELDQSNRRTLVSGVLGSIRPDLIDLEICQVAVELDPDSIRFVPSDLQTSELWQSALGHGKWIEPHIFADIRPGLATQALVRQALALNPATLRSMPDVLKTPEFILELVLENRDALCYVEQDRLTYDMCSKAIACWGGVYFESVPRQFRDADMAMMAVSTYGRALEYLDPALHTRELCRTAVANDAFALRWVAHSLQDQQMCTRAAGEYSGLVSYMRPDLVTREVHEAMVTRNAGQLGSIPLDGRDSEICRLAMQGVNGHWGFEFVPIHMQDATMCQYAVRGNWQNLAHVRPDLMSLDLCRLALEHNDSDVLQHIPAQYHGALGLLGLSAGLEAKPPLWTADVALQGLGDALARGLEADMPQPMGVSGPGA